MSAIDILREYGLTVEQLDQAWENEAKTNKSVQGFIRIGINWDELPDPAIRDLIKRQKVTSL